MASENDKGILHQSSPSQTLHKTKHSLTVYPGPLSIIGDPLGKVLGTAVKPLGAITGGVGKPAGEALMNVEKQAKEEKGWQDDPNAKGPGGDPIGGKQQTAENPLGL